MIQQYLNKKVTTMGREQDEMETYINITSNYNSYTI